MMSRGSGTNGLQISESTSNPPMTFTVSSFQLSQRQIDDINEHFSRKAEAFRKAGEDPHQSIKVVFEWMPIYGRSVSAYFDGEVVGHVVEDADG